MSLTGTPAALLSSVSGGGRCALGVSKKFAVTYCSELKIATKARASVAECGGGVSLVAALHHIILRLTGEYMSNVSLLDLKWRGEEGI